MKTKSGKGRGGQQQVRAYPNSHKPTTGWPTRDGATHKGVVGLVLGEWCLGSSYTQVSIILVPISSSPELSQEAPMSQDFPCKISIIFKLALKPECEGTSQAWTGIRFQFGGPPKWSPRPKTFLGIKQTIFMS